MGFTSYNLKKSVRNITVTACDGLKFVPIARNLRFARKPRKKLGKEKKMNEHLTTTTPCTLCCDN